MARSALLNIMVSAALKAGRSLSRDFGEVASLQVSIKGPGDFVSNADIQAEKIIKETLRAARPEIGFLMEESGVTQGTDAQNRWIVDPLDGTTNFLHGNPHFAVSIGLEREGKMVAGVIYNPITDELFVGERGRGSFLNDTRLRVANRQHLAECSLGLSLPNMGIKKLDSYLKEQAIFAPQVSALRATGSAALQMAYVAAGRLDGYWERGLSSWDMAAGTIIVREAGGYVTDLDGGQKFFETGEVCAGNEAIQKAIIGELK